jgi:hypothetical protein
LHAIGRWGCSPGAFSSLCGFPFDEPQFHRPIREGHAQAMDVGMARQQQRFDIRNLPAAPFDFDS